MKASLVDTNILSLFFRGHPQVVAEFGRYWQEYDTINFSIITYYEIVSGLKHRVLQILARLPLTHPDNSHPL
jgi:tRNA(fMet)-specific endonuclease VapC